MRIITAFDNHSYSARIVSEVAKLAANTWADMTMLGVQSSATGNTPESALANKLKHYRNDFLAQFDGRELPYDGSADSLEFKKRKDNLWELIGYSQEGDFRKKLLIKIRAGEPVKAILAEASEQESDLIVLGCTKGLDCQWNGQTDLPQRVAKSADCSTLVIKEKKSPDTITCFLDQTYVSQASLEMVNQVVTLYNAELKIIGLTDSKGVGGNEKVETRMAEILRYYADRKINAWIKLVRPEELEEYVAQVSRENMVALWMGKKSLLSKIFSRDLVGKLVNSSQSSVLILR